MAGSNKRKLAGLVGVRLEPTCQRRLTRVAAVSEVSIAAYVRGLFSELDALPADLFPRGGYVRLFKRERAPKQ